MKKFFEKMHAELWWEMSRIGREQSPLSMFTRKLSNCKTPEDYRNMAREFSKVANEAMLIADMLGDMAYELEDAEEA